MPWSPALDQDRWYKAIQSVSEAIKKTQDSFSDGDWDAVAEKYAQDGGRFKAYLPPDDKERDAQTASNDSKKISGLMTADVATSREAIAKNLEETKGKAAGDFMRFAHLVEQAPRSPARPAVRKSTTFSPVVPQLTEGSNKDDARQAMKALLRSPAKALTAKAPESSPSPTPVVEDRKTPRVVTPRKRASLSESVDQVAEGQDPRAVARKLINSALRRS